MTGRLASLVRSGLAGLALLAGACALPPPSAPATVIPSFSFALGANLSDIVATLGPPTQAPRLDRYSNLTQAAYTFPFPAVTVDTRLADGTVRSEVVDRLTLFFDADSRLVKMTPRPNPYYAVLTDLPVHRATVAPRMLARDGSIGPASIAR